MIEDFLEYDCRITSQVGPAGVPRWDIKDYEWTPLYSEDDRRRVLEMRDAIVTYLKENQNAIELKVYSDPFVNIYHLIGKDASVVIRTENERRDINLSVITGLRVEIRSGSNINDVVGGIMSVAQDLRKRD